MCLKRISFFFGVLHFGTFLHIFIFSVSDKNAKENKHFLRIVVQKRLNKKEKNNDIEVRQCRLYMVTTIHSYYIIICEKNAIYLCIIYARQLHSMSLQTRKIVNRNRNRNQITFLFFFYIRFSMFRSNFFVLFCFRSTDFLFFCPEY